MWHRAGGVQAGGGVSGNQGRGETGRGGVVMVTAVVLVWYIGGGHDGVLVAVVVAGCCCWSWRGVGVGGGDSDQGKTRMTLIATPGLPALCPQNLELKEGVLQSEARNARLEQQLVDGRRQRQRLEERAGRAEEGRGVARGGAVG